jgi:hypothetical protein
LIPSLAVRRPHVACRMSPFSQPNGGCLPPLDTKDPIRASCWMLRRHGRCALHTRSPRANGCEGCSVNGHQRLLSTSRRAVGCVGPDVDLEALESEEGGGHAADKSVAPGGNDRHTPLSFLSPTNQTLEAPPHTPVTLRCPCREESRLLPSMSESASPTNTTPKPKR